MTISNTAIDLHVGRRLRDLRTEHGLTMAELADALGRTWTQIQKWESGYNRMTAAQLYHAANHFRVPVTAFFDGIETADPYRDGMVEDKDMETALRLTARYLRRMTPTHRETVVKLARQLAGPAGETGELA